MDNRIDVYYVVKGMIGTLFDGHPQLFAIRLFATANVWPYLKPVLVAGGRYCSVLIHTQRPLKRQTASVAFLHRSGQYLGIYLSTIAPLLEVCVVESRCTRICHRDGVSRSYVANRIPSGTRLRVISDHDSVVEFAPVPRGRPPKHACTSFGPLFRGGSCLETIIS